MRLNGMVESSSPGCKNINDTNSRGVPSDLMVKVFDYFIVNFRNTPSTSFTEYTGTATLEFVFLELKEDGSAEARGIHNDGV